MENKKLNSRDYIKIVSELLLNMDEEVSIKTSKSILRLMNRVKNKKKPFPLFKKMTDAYDEFCKERIGVPGKFGAKECSALNSIIRYLQSIEKVKLGGDQAVVDSWNLILSNVDKWDFFHQNQLTINQIDSNLINILNAIRNGKRKTNIPESQSPADVLKRVLAYKEQQDRRNSVSNNGSELGSPKQLQ